MPNHNGLAGMPKTIEFHCQYEPSGAILVLGRLGSTFRVSRGVPGGGGSGRVREMVQEDDFQWFGGDA